MAKIKFDHAVIYNGKYYPANEEIEEVIAKNATTTETTPRKAVVEDDKPANRKPKSRTTK